MHRWPERQIGRTSRRRAHAGGAGAGCGGAPFAAAPAAGLGAGSGSDTPASASPLAAAAVCPAAEARLWLGRTMRGARGPDAATAWGLDRFSSWSVGRIRPHAPRTLRNQSTCEAACAAHPAHARSAYLGRMCRTLPRTSRPHAPRTLRSTKEPNGLVLFALLHRQTRARPLAAFGPVGTLQVGSHCKA